MNNDETQDMTLEQIRVAKSFFDHENSAILVSVLSEERTMLNLWKRKYELQLSLVQFNQPLQVSNILQKTGTGTAKKSDYLEFLLQE